MCVCVRVSVYACVCVLCVSVYACVCVLCECVCVCLLRCHLILSEHANAVGRLGWSSKPDV